MSQSQTAARDIQGLIEDISRVFNLYRTMTQKDISTLECLDMGKLYELFVLSNLLKLIKKIPSRKIYFKGKTLRFKSAPGKIKESDAHFIVCDSNTNKILLCVFVDIEFYTFGSAIIPKNDRSDRSDRHEIDIIMINPPNNYTQNDQGYYPKYSEIVLGVECKSTPKFKKSLLKEALGVRLELGPSGYWLEQSKKIKCDEILLPSVKLIYHSFCKKHILASADEAIVGYQQSPLAHGLKLWYLPIPEIVSNP